MKAPDEMPEIELSPMAALRPGSATGSAQSGDPVRNIAEGRGATIQFKRWMHMKASPRNRDNRWTCIDAPAGPGKLKKPSFNDRKLCSWPAGTGRAIFPSGPPCRERFCHDRFERECRPAIGEGDRKLPRPRLLRSDGDARRGRAPARLDRRALCRHARALA